MTLDCRRIDTNGFGRFQTELDNPEEQNCYFNIEKNNKLFDVFPSKKIRKSKLPADPIHFQIERVNSSMINNNKTFDATSKLESLISNGASISEYRREK